MRVRRRPLVVALSVAGLALACGGSVRQLEELPELRPAGTDASAGTWRMIAVSGPSQFPLAPPAAVASEDAVLSGVSADLLRLLFPAAIEEITLKAGQQREAALISGRASASDIAAGLALGKAVAAAFARSDGAD
jgi:hypothetical protein